MYLWSVEDTRSSDHLLVNSLDRGVLGLVESSSLTSLHVDVHHVITLLIIQLILYFFMIVVVVRRTDVYQWRRFPAKNSLVCLSVDAIIDCSKMLPAAS